MKNKMVQVRDRKTGQVSTIPMAELGHGMIEVNMMGVGVVWVNRSDFSATRTMPPSLHPPFSAEMKKSIKEEIMEPLAEVNPQTLAQWEAGFVCDINCEREIALWMLIAARFTAFVAANKLSRTQRKEVYMAMLHCSFVRSRAAFWETFAPQSLTREQLEAAIAPFEGNWRTSQELEQKLERVLGDGLEGARRAVAGAKVVIAKKRGDEGPVDVLFGRDEIERIEKNGGKTLDPLQFIYNDEEELRLVRYLVELVKGVTEY